MRGVKDEASRIPPLFPRLHVNDTDRGGRSQLRNQTAPYEQLTVPSPRQIYDLPSTRTVGGGEKNRFRPFCNTAATANLTDKLKSASCGVNMQNATVGSLGGKLTKGLNHPNVKGSISPITKPSSFERNDLCKFKNFSFKNLSSSDYLKVPSVSHLLRDSSCEKDLRANADLSLQLHTSSRKAMEEATELDEESTKNLRNQCDDDGRVQSQDSLNSLQDCKPSKRPESARNQEIRTPTKDTSVEERSSFKEKNQSSRKSLIGLNKGYLKRNETIRGHERVLGFNSHEDVSDCSIMDSASGLSASPDNIVKVIGDKHFWTIRTVLINQQRVFAAQVFELHKLITVQKTLARLPNLVLEPATAKESSSPVLEMVPKIKPSISNLKPKAEFSDDHSMPKLPLPSITKNLVTHQPTPAMTGEKPSSSLWFPPPANQWLVPVMSPSEGLIYKPYTGPCPPTSGFMAPLIYGNDMFNTALRFPHHHQFSIDSCFQSTSMSSPVVEQVNAHAQAQSPCSHISQVMPCFLRKPEASKDSEIQGSTASGPPKRPKWEILPLFPTEPMYSNAETDYEHREHAPLHAIKAIPHRPLSAPESAARIFQTIQEERQHYDCRIS